MAEDSHPLGGRRSVTRHGTETGVVTAFSAIVIGKFGAVAGLDDPFYQAMGLAVLTGILGSLAKVWNENGLTKKLLAKAGLAALLLPLLGGCAIQLGTSTPEAFTGPMGETIIACEVRGVSVALGDGGVCQNIEGGHVSSAFSALWQGTVGSALNLVGAFLGRPPVAAPVAVPPHDHPPAIVAPAAPAPSSASSSAGGPTVEVPDWYELGPGAP